MTILITSGDLINVIKKSRLETIPEEQESDNTDGGLEIDTDEIIIEAEADKFIALFKKTFTEETEEIDSEGGPAQDILAKIVLKIKEKLQSIDANGPAIRFLRLITYFFQSILQKNGKNKSNIEAETSNQ